MTREELQKQPEKNNKMAMNTHLSVITLNVTGLNVPINRHRMANWIKKKKTPICCLKETHFRTKDTQAESDNMEKIFRISYEWKRQESWSSNTYNRQN